MSPRDVTWQKHSLRSIAFTRIYWVPCCQPGSCQSHASFAPLVHGKIPRSFINMGVSKIRGTPKSSILIGFSIISHPFWDIPIFGNTHMFPRSWILWGFSRKGPSLVRRNHWCYKSMLLSMFCLHRHSNKVKAVGSYIKKYGNIFLWYS